MRKFRTAIALVAAAAISFGWLAWKCVHDPKINFLSRDGRAEWILFPAALDSRTHPVAAVDATFRRTFELGTLPKSTHLKIRAAKRVELKINGEPIELNPGANWKDISTVEVARFLHVGTNNLEARVFNDNAPPAFWLALTVDSFTVQTDEKWEVSLAGSAPRAAARASRPRVPGPGNWLAGGETTLSMLPKIWRMWIALAVAAILISIGIDQFIKRSAAGELSRRSMTIALSMAGLLWVAMFWNNLSMLPFHTGFDSREHVDYIKHIQEKHALPLPNEGFEAFQPPLYYMMSAAALSGCGLKATDDGAVTVLRILGMCFGIANFVLAFLSVRLLTPGRSEAQFVALLLAAFLPMHLYLSQYATNELLPATLVTATIYFALRLFKNQSASAWQYFIVGCFAGAATLAKATGIVLIPWLLVALAFSFAQKRTQLLLSARGVLAVFAGSFVVCGWHYIRIWRHFGKPIVGNWDPAVGFAWWQDPGFHTAGDYFRFGQSLSAPLFSGFKSFADGIYSTLWGDGLCGGLSDLLSRTPWNYDLMVGGYPVALVPTLLLMIGIVVAIIALFRQYSPHCILLIGFAATIAFGVAFMTLKVPSYAQVKAFYGLSVLTPLCWFGAIGWEKLANRRRILELGLIAVLIFWALNSFCSFWIRDSESQRMYAARKLFVQSKEERGKDEARRALEMAPSSAAAHCFFSEVLMAEQKIDDALQHAQKGVELNPSDGDCHAQLAVTLGAHGEFERAAAESRRALELEPENQRAYKALFSCERALQRSDEAVRVARETLVVSPFDPDLHYRFGLAAAESGNFAVAIPQFGYALLLQPNRSEIAQKLQLAFSFAVKSPNAADELAAIAATAPDLPDLRNQLAWILATNPNSQVRSGTEALRQSERACALTNRSRPDFLATLAAAYAETGNFSAAISTAQEARRLASDRGDEKTARLAENLIATFQINQPYREETPR